jgi:hypothetical protein
MSQVEAQERDGWTRRFTAIGARLSEAVELYRGLGFEIRLAPAEPGVEGVTDSAACAQCFVMTLAQTIYTRPIVVRPSKSEIAAER